MAYPLTPNPKLTFFQTQPAFTEHYTTHDAFDFVQSDILVDDVIYEDYVLFGDETSW